MNELVIFQGLIRYNKADRFKEMLDESLINIPDKFQRTAVHIASAQSNPIYLKTILELGGIVDVKDNEGRTPLYYASELFLTENVKLLLEKNANPNIVNKHGNNPLWAAIYSSRGKEHIIKQLLDSGVNPLNMNIYGKSCVDFANEIGFQNIKDLIAKYSDNMNGD
jgi:uncharacterized protein